MEHFTYRNRELSCDAVSLRASAGTASTPTYVSHLLRYSVTANSNLAVLGTLAQVTFARRRETYEDLAAGEMAS